MDILDGKFEAGGIELSYDWLEGEGPALLFLGGYASARKSVKGSLLFEYARRAGRPYLRFDYSGHGDSAGRFEDATLGLWLDQALAVFDRLLPADRPVVVVGSSMGGWIALLLALRRAERLAGVITVACGADFTEEVLRKFLPPEVFAELERRGVVYKPSPGGETPTPLAWKFMEEAKSHLLLGGPIEINCPVRLFHGLKDADVPWEISRRVLEKLTSTDATLLLVKEGDHRLSTTADMERLTGAIDALCGGRRPVG